MPIRFRCSHCDKLLAVGTRMAGSSLRCPICNNPLVAPEPHSTTGEAGSNPITILPLGGENDAWWVDSPPLPPPSSAAPSTEAAGVPVGAPRGEPAAWWVSGEPPLPPPSEPAPAAPAQEGPPRPPLPGATPSPPRPYPLLTWALRSRVRLALVIGAGVAVMLTAGLLTGLLLKHRSHPKHSRPATELTTRASTPEPEPVAPKKPERPPVSEPSDRANPPPRPDPEIAPADRVKLPEPEPPPPPVRDRPPPLGAAVMTPRFRPLVYKRRRQLDEDELRRQAERAPEIGLNRAGDRSEDRRMLQLAQVALAEGRQIDIAPMLMRQRVDLAGLPFRMGQRCRCDPTTAEHLEGGSLALRALLVEATQAPGPGLVPAGDTPLDPKKLRQTLTAAGKEQKKWLRSDAIGALLQLLMAENAAVRSLLVEQLARIEGARASAALAQRALFDLDADVRKQALEALNTRPAEEYLQVLLDGFRYPWPVVADHAAEAVAALQLREAVPALLRLLDQSSPQAPYTRPGKEGHFLREMVRINHPLNCLMCHAPSFSPSDRVRGYIPPTDQPLPPAFSREVSQRRLPGQLVRADVTYLQQDFAVPLTVKKPGKWPDRQSYDFLVRERPALVADLQAHRTADPTAPTEYQQAIFFALRELTGTDPGPTVESWKRLFLGGVQIEALGKAVAAPSGLAFDDSGLLLVSSTRDRQLLRESDDGTFLPLGVNESGKKLLDTPCQGLALDSKGRLCVCAMEAGRILVIEPGSHAVRVLVEAYQGKPLHGPVHLVAESKGGLYFSDAAGTKEAGAVYHVTAQGTVRQLPLLLGRPRGLGLSPDGKSLYVVSDNSHNVMVYPLDGAGLPGAGRVLCKLQEKKNSTETGAEGLAVDAQGNLYVACTALRAIQVFSSQGASLGLISLPEAPRYCAIVGNHRKTLYVSTQGGLFKMQLQAKVAGLNGQGP